ncbi:MAG: type II toxin-antitoxin system PemK/MazF family toxin [bacterium]|nr:type II toxin-antitoxin system PemK/MazF family toxin [bacterium]
MARILRGDVYWADLNPVKGQEQAGRRPILVISQNVFNERSGTVIAMAITGQSQRAGFPLTLEIGESGMPKRSWVKISQIRTLSVLRLDEQITHLPPEFVNQVVDGLNEIVGA